MRVEHRSQRDDHRTPESILDRVRQIDPILLDPATTKDNPTGAEYIRTPDCDPDGLETVWHEFDGLIYVNPPYGREHNRVWPQKIAVEGSKGAEIVALVAARTGSLWWEHMWSANRICFVRGRLRFKGAESGAPFDSALCYWGRRPKRFDRAMQGLGRLIRP